MVKNKMARVLLTFLMTLSIFSLSSCGRTPESRTMFADVILLDISSGMDKFGTFNEEDHSTSSLSSRATQLRTKLLNALDERRAVYFGFVRKTYGQQQIETLVSPKLIQLVDSVLDEEIKDASLRKDAKEGILEGWKWALNQPEGLSSSKCEKVVSDKISYSSNGEISEIKIAKVASSLCSNAQAANEQIAGLRVAPENIGSEIQAAVDRSIEKLASDERRLVNKDGQPIALIPTVILVSDLIQVTNGIYILDELRDLDSPEAACKKAESTATNYEVKIFGISLISDGFASTEGNINTELRDKLREYWKCWFNSRGIDEQDLGARGINLGDI
jgi:hypothetical protein